MRRNVLSEKNGETWPVTRAFGFTLVECFTKGTDGTKKSMMQKSKNVKQAIESVY